MEIDTTNLEKYNPENLNTLQQVEFAIKDVQKEEERLKQVLNLTNGEQTQLREVLSNGKLIGPPIKFINYSSTPFDTTVREIRQTGKR